MHYKEIVGGLCKIVWGWKNILENVYAVCREVLNFR